VIDLLEDRKTSSDPGIEASAVTNHVTTLLAGGA
jgi:hypothetical protein